ncbi:MAG: hypothetical protein HOW73_47325, partial [Polyangiaceae bacterium]|nr:hypothetical protein [Polyangiaceae bacterium]
MMNLRQRLLSCAFIVGAVASGCIVSGCVTESDEASIPFACPSEAEWPVVSQVLERKCGTMDCHGDRARPFRLFGRNGMRESDNNVVGSTDPTTTAELRENRASACGLEPEKMDAVVVDGEDLETLTLVRKPRLIEAHKGGLVWNEDSPGFVCLT